MSETYDVIIVGAGPAGGTCARELAKKSWKVLLIERSKEIGEPNFSSGGIPYYLLDEFSLPQSIVADYWDKFQVVTPSHKLTWKYNNPKGYVLKFNELKKFLVKDAQDFGCTVMSGRTVEDLLQKDNKINGVIIKDTNERIFGKIIIDASGLQGIIASKVGLRKPVISSLTIGMEHIMNNVNFPTKHVLSFFLGRKFTQNGYSWIFPMGENKVKVGSIIYESTKYKTNNKSLVEQLNRFAKSIDWLNNANIEETHGGSIFISGGIKKLVFSNVLAVGDSAALINPLGAEGIRHAMRAARMAAQTIDKTLTSGNLENLYDYEKMWKNYSGKKWRISRIFADFFYHKLNDNMLDKFFYLLKSLPADDIFNLVFEYKFRIFLKVFRKIKLF